MNDIKNQLYLDVTTKECVIALYKNELLIDYLIVETNNNLTDLVVELINELLFKYDLVQKDLDQLYLNNGPGSFTGVRVGIIIARTIKVVYPHIQIFVNDALSIYALDLKNALLHLDAKGSKSYLLTINNGVKSEYRIITNNELANVINEAKDMTIIDANNIDFKEIINKLVFSNFTNSSLKDIKANYVKLYLS